ncbi:MAG: hypothetical protein ABEJ28_06795 [Salinigranum sp.]
MERTGLLVALGLGVALVAVGASVALDTSFVSAVSGVIGAALPVAMIYAVIRFASSPAEAGDAPAAGPTNSE